jgi:ATP-dependent Clp protease ATP-binding subunit ClpA
MAEIRQTERVSRILNKACEYCREYKHEFIMPEHLLMVLIDEYNFNATLNIFCSPHKLQERLKQ